MRPRPDHWVVPAAAVPTRPWHPLPVGRGPPIFVTAAIEEDGALAVEASIVDAIVAAGGHPVVLGPSDEAEALRFAAKALVVTGGAFDIHPHHYGQAVVGRLDPVAPARTATELAFTRAALAHGVPILGLCGGHQVLAVASGGTLIQDLPAEPTHEQPTDPARPWHPVRLSGRAADVLGPLADVNSTHHQAVDAPGEGLEVVGWSPDGVVEALAHRRHPFAIGVQWHPERLGDVRLFAALVAATR